MLKRFFKDESGQGMVEYALIIALIAIVVIVALSALSGNIKGVFENSSKELEKATKNTTPQIACFSVQSLSKSLQSRFFEKTGITTLFGRVAGC